MLALPLSALMALLAGCSADSENSNQAADGAEATRAEAAAAVASAGSAALVGTWTGTASQAPTTRMEFTGGTSLCGLTLMPFAALGDGPTAVQPVTSFTWTITCAAGPGNAVVGSYFDTAGRSGTVSGTGDRDSGAVSLTISGTHQGQTDFGVAFTMSLNGVVTAGATHRAPAEWEITRASMSLAGAARVSLASDAHQLPDFLQMEWQDPTATEPLPEPVLDAVLIEEDILDP